MNEYCDENDEHTGVAAAVRAQRDRMPMGVPVERIISRGRTVRNRRRIPTAAAVLATAGAAVFAVTALAPPAARSTTATTQLAAWSVDESKPGEIVITVRQLHDPAGLQARLRADGVAAVVTFSEPEISSPCRFLKDDVNALPDARALAASISGFSSGDSSIIVLHPAAIPSGDGVFISVGFNAPSVSEIATSTAAKPKAGQATPHPLGFSVELGLVQASPQCTGS